MIAPRLLPILLFIALFLPAPASARVPSDQILGLQLGMPRSAAITRLERLGSLVDPESREAMKQSWRLNDPRYGTAVIRFNNEGRMQWFSIFRRAGGRVVRFRDIGDLKQAKKIGAYIYVWNVPARSRRDPYQVVARSVDPDTLQSLSISLISAKAVPGSEPDSLH